MGLGIDFGGISDSWGSLQSKMTSMGSGEMDPGEILQLQQEMALFQMAVKAAQEFIQSYKQMMLDGLAQTNKG